MYSTISIKNQLGSTSASLLWDPKLDGVRCVSQKSFLVEVPDRTAATLEAIITE